MTEPEIFPKGRKLLNTTRVTTVRLIGHKPTGGVVEALVMRKATNGLHEVLLKPSKRIRAGTKIQFQGGVEGEVVEGGDEMVRYLSLSPESEALLQAAGSVPLPPYIHQSLDDAERYQTVYNQVPGSAAAPTAGLHFTPAVLDALRAKGVGASFVTLSVGLDTFRPVSVDETSDHVMHGEMCAVGPDTAEKIENCRGRVVAVGTTTARTLETHATGPRKINTGTLNSKIFITPGYEFKIVDGLLTNFHMPRTTMLLMLAALVGVKPLMKAYGEAVQHQYRFLSFGDSMLLI